MVPVSPSAFRGTLSAHRYRGGRGFEAGADECLAGQFRWVRPDPCLYLVDILSRQAHGLRDWLLQRVTAVYLGSYVVYLMAHFFMQPPQGYEQWHAWIGQPLVAIASAGFILAMLLHGWVGIRDVIFDYIHSVSLRLMLLSLIGLLLVACGFWVLRVLVLATA